MKTLFQTILVTLAAMLFSAAAWAGTTPRVMHISCAHPKPPHQTGLKRAFGDGDMWTFKIVTDGDAHFAKGPYWHYPGKNGGDSDWGMVLGGHDGDTTLGWLSPQESGDFSVTVTGKISCGSGGGGGGEGKLIDFSAGWEGQVYNYDIKVRRKSSGDNYSSSATVAVGAIDNAGHKASVEVEATDDDGNPMAGVTIPDLVIKSEGQDVPHTINATVSMAETKTDANGLAHGTFLSGNRTEDSTITTDDDDSTTSATVTQAWNEKAGTSSAWEYPEYFYPGEAMPIAYIMSFDGGNAIKGHDVSFKVTKITGSEWDPNKQVDDNGDGIVDYVGGYNDDISYSPNQDGDIGPGGIYNNLVTFVKKKESPDGYYNANMTIDDYKNQNGEVDFYVQSVEFDVIDNSSLTKN